MSETFPNKYVIALEAGPESTLHTFSDPSLWAWLTAETAFPYGATRGTVSIPGTTAKASVSVASSVNDRAQALVIHRLGIGVDPVECDDYSEALEQLIGEVGAINVYAGYLHSTPPSRNETADLLTVTLTTQQLNTVLSGLHDKLLDSRRYLSGMKPADEPGPEDTCCAPHLARYERDKETYRMLKSQKKHVQETIALFEKLLPSSQPETKGGHHG